MKPNNAKWDAQFYQKKHDYVYQYGQSIVEMLQPQEDELILDLGCGSGQLTAEIAKAAHAIGMDKSEEMIAEAQNLYPDIQFIVGDAAEFELKQKFDAIFSNATLHWVLDYQSAIQNIHRHLKKNGRFVAEFGGIGNVELITNQIRIELKKRNYIAQSEKKVWYFPSIGQYTFELEKAGFYVKFAKHYDRLTELSDEQSGIKDWVMMFGIHFFNGVEATQIEQIAEAVQQNLHSQLFQNGKWYADYKRIYIEAIAQ